MHYWNNLSGPDAWPDLVFDTTIEKYVYKDKFCTAFAKVTVHGAIYTLDLEIIPKYNGLLKNDIHVDNIDINSHINYPVGERLREWQKEPGNAALIAEIKHRDTATDLLPPVLISVLRNVGISDADIKLRTGLMPLPVKAPQTTVSAKYLYLLKLQKATGGIKCRL